MDSLGPTIETERLILRPPAAEDFEGFCTFMGDSEAAKHIGGVQSPPVVWRTMRTIAGGWALDGFHMFSVIEKESGNWIGRIGPIHPEGWPGREVGWGLVSRAWGKGYAREASVAAMNFAFDILGWDRVIHTIDPENTPSVALARALGSYRIGPGKLPEPYGHLNVEIWGQSRDEWRTRLAQAGDKS
jgi:RimJ/RimL family protein N-acetyltransferase